MGVVAMGDRLAARRFGVGEQNGLKRRPELPRLTGDALALGLAYYAAYLLRFDGDPPGRYQDLFVQTLPFAIVGGLGGLALTGNDGTARIGAFRLIKGVALATLALIAYAAVVQPTLVVTAQGLTVLDIRPADRALRRHGDHGDSDQPCSLSRQGINGLKHPPDVT